jgi:hypothetical protein
VCGPAHWTSRVRDFFFLVGPSVTPARPFEKAFSVRTRAKPSADTALAVVEDTRHKICHHESKVLVFYHVSEVRVVLDRTASRVASCWRYPFSSDI